MKKQLRIVVAAVCAFAMVGAFALTGCSSNSSSTEQKSDSTQTEQSADNNKEQVELQVFAANSLSKAMEEVQAAYIADGHTNVSFADTQYKASGELNEMLGAGSYADLLISASKGSMDTAAEKGYVDSSTRVDMFKNDLVMVSKEGTDIKDVTLQDIADGKYTFCVGDESVPAGNYACQSLSTVGVYLPPASDEGKTGKDISGKGGSYQAFVDAGHKVVTDTSVGNVCKHAQSGDVDVAFVYTSDVYRFGGVQIVGTVPADTHKNIVYPGAITSNCKNTEATQEFLDWCLSSDKAQEIWQKWGFELA
ncbi:extracellular solute-binding protein [uncultured Senegalimassilia sp.]|uniref:molybdate ABC transporter substrate-binding protein n=1 Tax=uncultured Senegalimassilia sp. TaxID=1714350 RepID=UPI0026DEE8E6|nr:extracellular solute-binding protein [uncultured Senegalimassilia sp.]